MIGTGGQRPYCRLMRRIGLGLRVVVAAMWLASCGPTTTAIDGQEVGIRVCDGGENEPIDEPTCSKFMAFARTKLDNEQPEHATVTDLRVFLDPARFKNGGVYGDWVIVIARLADGTSAIYRLQCFDPASGEGCPTESSERP